MLADLGLPWRNPVIVPLLGKCFTLSTTTSCHCRRDDLTQGCPQKWHTATFGILKPTVIT